MDLFLGRKTEKIGVQLKLKIKRVVPDAKLPEYAHSTDAGMDLFSCEDCKIMPGEIRAVRTGISMEIPDGHAGLIWDKSSLPAQNGIHKMAGVIDSGYRGEILVVLANFGKQEFEIKKHRKIAQMLIQKIEIMELEETGEELGATARGNKGFGSTGK